MTLTETLDPIIQGFTVEGEINTATARRHQQIAHALRLGHPQVRREGKKSDAIAIVGSGPSLAETERELRDVVYAGAKIVSLNGSYAWLLDHNFKPSAHVIVDAQPHAARFVGPEVPQCLYLLASQCHADTWAKVETYERVFIWHAMAAESDDAPLCNAYYGADRWLPVIGGTSVASRALTICHHLGYVRFHCFGIDCCWLDGQHHAFPQPENDVDRKVHIDVTVPGSEMHAEFTCAPWHVQQLEDFLQMIRLHGEHFIIAVHGRGLLAHALQAHASLSIKE